MTMYSESLRAFLKPVLAYLDDDSVTEVLINGPEDVWVERRGKLFKTDARFTEEGLLGAARNMAQFVGRPLSDERPRLDARLPDGSRIHVVLFPVARKGTTLSIRKFFKEKPSVDALLNFGTLTQPMARLLEAAIHLKLNMVVAGGTGSGKTTLLNILSSLIPDEERIVTIEDSAELQLNRTHLVSLESRPADKFGKGAIDMGDLVHSSLRLRPDRIVVGEVRGGEAFHLIQAMNTGHGGAMTTVHANTPTDTLRRLESLCLMSAVDLPMVAVRAQVASAVNLVVCCERLHDGTRKVTSISQVLPLNDKGEYRTQELFVYTPLTRDEEGDVIGYHAPTGVVPTFLARVRAYGFGDLDERFFDPATYELPPPPAFALGEEVKVRWAPSLEHRARGEEDGPEAKAGLDELEQRLMREAAQRRAAAPKAVTVAAARAEPAPKQRPAEGAGEGAAAASKPRADLGTAPAGPTRPASPAPAAAATKRQEPTRDEDATPPPTRNPFPTGTKSEALVQVSEELLEDAASHNTAVRTYPPKPNATPARPGQTARPSAAAPARKPGERTEENTDIRPVPDKFRR